MAKKTTNSKKTAKKTTKRTAKKTSTKIPKAKLSAYRYSMEDMQKATGMKDSTFRVWKAKNNKKLARGLVEFSIYDPQNPNRKLFNKPYFDRILALRSKVKPHSKHGHSETFTVNVKGRGVEAFQAVARTMDWKIK
jgi:hypothetical protein